VITGSIACSAYAVSLFVMYVCLLVCVFACIFAYVCVCSVCIYVFVSFVIFGYFIAATLVK